MTEPFIHNLQGVVEKPVLRRFGETQIQSLLAWELSSSINSIIEMVGFYKEYFWEYYNSIQNLKMEDSSLEWVVELCSILTITKAHLKLEGSVNVLIILWVFYVHDGYYVVLTIEFVNWIL